MVSKNFMESLNELVTDSRFRSLAVTQNFEGFFNEFGMNESEHAYMLSWFMNPTGSHGFKDIFLKEFFTTCWSMIHGQYRSELKDYKTTSFYTKFMPLHVQSSSFMSTHIDRDMKRDYRAADMVITDISQRLMVVVNNRAEKTECEKAYTYFNGTEFDFFEHKLFVSLDAEVQSFGHKWLFLSNDWLVNLCSTLIDGYKGHDSAGYKYLADYYQFLTGSQFEKAAEYSSTFVTDFYQTLTDLKNYKSEAFAGQALVCINPCEYVKITNGKMPKHEEEILSLYWSYRNTFNTFFHLAELEGVTKNMNKGIEKKSYNFERTFIRNGLRFSPVFNKLTTGQEFMNHIFNVEAVQDWNRNLTISLVVNKPYWDKLSDFQRQTIQKNFGWSGMVLTDKATVWSKSYKQEWKNTDLSQDVISTFDRVEEYLNTLSIRVA